MSLFLHSLKKYASHNCILDSFQIKRKSQKFVLSNALDNSSIEIVYRRPDVKTISFLAAISKIRLKWLL